MREVTDRLRLEGFLSALSRNVEDELHVYLVGGATALLYGWRAMLELELVTPKSLRDYFSAIEPRLYRYPALDANTFRSGVERALTKYEQQRQNEDCE